MKAALILAVVLGTLAACGSEPVTGPSEGSSATGRPPDLPEDVVFPPGFSVLSATSDDGGHSIAGRLPVGLDDAEASFGAAMISAGWTPVGQPSMASPDVMRTLFFEKEDRAVGVRLVAGESATEVEITTATR